MTEKDVNDTEYSYKEGMKMYEVLLTNYEISLNRLGEDYKKVAELLDLIIKIKTIQAMDVSAEMIAYSRRVSRN